MPGPRFDAGNSKARKVRPSRVLKSTSSLGKMLTVIALLEKNQAETNDSNDYDGYNKSYCASLYCG
jgi:hypothetical protein